MIGEGERSFGWVEKAGMGDSRLTARFAAATRDAPVRQRRSRHASRTSRLRFRGATACLFRGSQFGFEERVGQLKALQGEPQEAITRAGGGLQEHVPLPAPTSSTRTPVEPVQDRVHLDEDALDTSCSASNRIRSLKT